MVELTAYGATMAKNKITIKPEHILLLKEISINWQDSEYGAPEVNPKRPYGNSSGSADVCRVLGWVKNPDYNEWSKSQLANARALHEEMLYVLKVLCQNPHGIEVGATYENMSKYYGDDWRRVS